ncbi:hypothetical protein HYX11_00520 [Candidatus Woesearchaeota archaeon]|nr:hypothetical protein [Candidatus Woesearchaeota archaeon]
MLDEIQKLALETIEINKQALIFLPSRASAEKTAEDLSHLTSLSQPELEHAVLKVVSSPTKQCRRLSHCIRKGIAFHHSGLTNDQKEIIENSFREGRIKIICCTPTLAAGVSTPAFRVLIKSLKRFNDRWGQDWIPVLEYMQMAGRAGRPEYEKFGEAIIIAKNEAEKEEIYEKYICGVPEDIYSKLAAEPTLRTYLLSLISSGIIKDDQSMHAFFSKTFWAHQYQDLPKLQTIIHKMLTLLKEWEFIALTNSSIDSEFTPASKLNHPKEQHMRATLLGKRISELYLDPLTARHLIDNLNNFNTKKKIFSLLQMISHTLEMRPLLRVKAKEQDYIQEQLVKNYDSLLKEEPSAYDLDYDDFINSIKTTLFFSEWIEEKDEDYLLEKYDIRPGEIKVKLDLAEWLLYASEEISKILDNHHAVKEIHKLRLCIQYGVKEELLALLKLKGIGRIRARKLYTNNLKDLGDIKTIDLTTLSQILGKVLAEDIKQQLGEDIPEQISAKKRIGQMSLGKY